MTADFTFAMMDRLLNESRSAGYDHITIRDYLSDEVLPDRFVIHRHDVDRKPENSLTMARLEASHDISATYYFRTIEKTFVPAIIAEIEALGHEIGYHYEDLDRTNGDVERAHESFADELERLREVATIDTVCMHGNPLTPHDNRDLWRDHPRFDDYGLMGEAYLSLDFEDVVYFSDTGRTWRDGRLKVKDHPVGDAWKPFQVKTTTELIDRLSQGQPARSCLLSHPNRWAGSAPEYVTELAKDTMTNAGKQVLQLLR